MPPKKQPAKKVFKKRAPKKVTRYTHDDAKDPRTPETGHTALLPGEETVVSVPMDNGWTDTLAVGKLEADPDTTVVVDMDPAVDPVLLWSGKRNRREVPVLPLQRNEIVSESRIAQIIERARRNAAIDESDARPTLFADLERELRESDKEKRVEFYTHDEAWRNKLICGDSLPVMESLLTYERLAGQVQMIYVDPPYGIAYDSNFQQRIDSTKNDVKDLADDVLQVRAYRDTWSLGIHSYLAYLSERLYLARDLVTDSGSVFVQMNIENEHLVRQLMDEVFGATNFVTTIAFSKTTGFTDKRLSSVFDCLVWYAKDGARMKYRQLFENKSLGLEGSGNYNRVEEPTGKRRTLKSHELAALDSLPDDSRIYRVSDIASPGAASKPQPFEFDGELFEPPPNSHWKTTLEGMERLAQMGRIERVGKRLYYVRFADDFAYSPINNMWTDTGRSGFGGSNLFTVQTHSKVLERCIAMTTDPGDLVFDPTCGSGTTALASELLARRWITCDTSRVALNVARQRLLSAHLPHFELHATGPQGGLVYESATRITLKSLAHDLEPEHVNLVDRPVVDLQAVRICGPFEVMTLGRYSLDDWNGYLIGGEADPEKLENYVEVVCRLYRPDAELAGEGGFVHALAPESKGNVAISIGPLTGRVTARQVFDAATEAKQVGSQEVHVLGWAFEANVGEEITNVESEYEVTVRPVMIRPDALAEGLKVTKPDDLFSPLALPDVRIDSIAKSSEVTVTLEGVGLFDRKTKTTRYHQADDGYVAAWYLDEDYDGDCFVDCQMFFAFKKAPNLKSAAGVEVEKEEFELALTSEPFEPGEYRRLAVKVVDVYGNESTVVRDL